MVRKRKTSKPVRKKKLKTRIKCEAMPIKKARNVEQKKKVISLKIACRCL